MFLGLTRANESVEGEVEFSLLGLYMNVYVRGRSSTSSSSHPYVEMEKVLFSSCPNTTSTDDDVDDDDDEVVCDMDEMMSMMPARGAELTMTSSREKDTLVSFDDVP